MATTKPMTPAELVAAFRRWDVPYVEQPGWRHHDRNHKGGWGPMNGIGIHHTGDDTPDDRSDDFLRAGRSDLPGPLCNWGMRDDGVAVMIGGGRANHFGRGSLASLNHVTREDYHGELKPGSDSVDGNTRFYGQETMYSGGHPMTLKAYRSTVRACAAICEHHGWSAHHVIGHREWTRRKIDPGKVKMFVFRRRVAACLAAGPGNWKSGKERPLIPEITQARTRIRKITDRTKRPRLKKILLAADQQLAKIERG